MTTYNLDKLLAVLPEAIHESMKTALPHRYTPELADAIATQTIAELQQMHRNRAQQPDAADEARS